jgi:hypothetical protein
LLRRRLARRLLPWRQHWASHAVVSLFIWGYAAVGVLLAVAYPKDTAALILACLGLGAWFLLTYRLLFQGLRMRSLA